MTDSSGSKTFKRDGVYVTDPVLSDGTATFTPSGEVRAGTKTTFHSGPKNDDIQTSSTGTTTASKLFDAFGNQIAATGTWNSPFAYAGKFGYQQDPDSNLKLLGHRYYDPSTGRFLTRDTQKDGKNWYGYGGGTNNPVSGVDASGLAYILFDGNWLYLISDDGTGPKVVAKVPAASGAPGSGRNDQSDRNKGPIPAGEYFVDRSEISSWELGGDEWFAPRGTYEAGLNSWGAKRLPIHSKRGTNVYERGGFFLHGSRYVGSLGCIDIGLNMALLYFISQMIMYSSGKKMTLIVDYSTWAGTVPEARGGGKKSWWDEYRDRGWKPPTKI